MKAGSTLDPCCLGGVVVSVLATGSKGGGFERGQGDGFLRAIQIRSTPSFGWEVKTEVPCHNILWHVKISYHDPHHILPAMNNRSIEAAVLRRQSHPIITNVTIYPWSVGQFVQHNTTQHARVFVLATLRTWSLSSVFEIWWGILL
jgi:hypothetical protein